MIATAKKIPLIGPDPLTPEWFTWRKTSIGASEAAAACGVHPYKTPLHLYAEKTGEIAPFAGNEHTRRGRRYEPLIAEDWQEQTGIKLRSYPAPMFRHPEIDWMTCTPDGVIDESSGLEIKSSTWCIKSRLGDEGTDAIPEEWLLQAQHQMAVMQWSRVEFAILVDLELNRFTVERNDQFIDDMIAIERELIERIRNSDPPPPNWEHPATPSLIKQMFDVGAGITVIGTPEIASLWAKDCDLQQKEKAIKEERDVTRAKILHLMSQQDASTVILPDDGIELYASQVAATVVPEHTRAAYIKLAKRKLKGKR